jgi:uncharacterized membrane protein
VYVTDFKLLFYHQDFYILLLFSWFIWMIPNYSVIEKMKLVTLRLVKIWHDCMWGIILYLCLWYFMICILLYDIIDWTVLTVVNKPCMIWICGRFIDIIRPWHPDGWFKIFIFSCLIYLLFFHSSFQCTSQFFIIFLLCSLWYLCHDRSACLCSKFFLLLTLWLYILPRYYLVCLPDSQ